MIRSRLVSSVSSWLDTLLLVCLILLILVLVLHLSQQILDLVARPVQKSDPNWSEVQYSCSTLSLWCLASLCLLLTGLAGWIPLLRSVRIR
jgi:hypothetical protein